MATGSFTSPDHTTRVWDASTGRILADLTIEGSTAYDIAGFEADRPIMTMEDPPTSFLI